MKRCVLLVLAACGGASSSPSTPAPTPTKEPVACGAPIPGAEGLTYPGSLAVLGEVHGTAQAPAFTARLACEAAQRGPVTIGLEIPRDEQGRIDAYVASSGGDARAALLASDFWTRAYQDGRSSEAMLALLESLRALRTGGADVRVLAFDIATGASGEDRDQAMAQAVLADRAAHPARSMVLLTGNLHARRHAGLPPLPEMVPMTSVLLAAVPDLVSFDMAAGPGTYWACFGDQASDCGQQSGRGHGIDGPVRIDREVARNGYDGVFVVGPIEASRPVTQRDTGTTPVQRRD
jgi:hypothetical protein